MELLTAKALFVRAIVGLCICSLTYGLPLPRLALQQGAAYWELRPASKQLVYSPDSNTLYDSYTQGRLDPDRPFIQMIIPRTNGIADSEAKPGGPFGPTQEPEFIPISLPSPSPSPVCNITNVSCSNTDTNPEVESPDAIIMLADGTSLYAVGGQARKSESSPGGAYELAFVEHRPRTVHTPSPQLYPVIQYADYNLFPWGGYGRSPLLNYAGAYEPVYIYKPVYPSASRSYDVYYYLPVAEHQSTEHESTNVNAEKEEAKETAMPNAVKNSEADVQVQVPVKTTASNTVDSQAVAVPEGLAADTQSKNELLKEEVKMEEAEQEEEEEVGDKMRTHWEEELERISDQDLINAVDKVLQQLHSRLLTH